MESLSVTTAATGGEVERVDPEALLKDGFVVFSFFFLFLFLFLFFLFGVGEGRGKERGGIFVKFCCFLIFFILFYDLNF